MRTRVLTAACAGLLSLAAAVSGCGSDGAATTATQAQSDPFLAVRLKEQQARNRKLQREIERLQREQRRQEDQGPDAIGGTGGAGADSATRASFDRLASGMSGEVGVAYGPPGTEQRVTSLGSLTGGVAWSTAKVPVAIAVVRANGGTAGDQAGSMRSAITASDNAAAELLWSSLGSADQAGARTQAVLSDTGDVQTRVQTQRVRSGFTPFGQTEWSLTNAEKFAAALPCLQGAAPVLDLMGQVTPDQSWGLGQAGSNQRFKGGWGPDANGKYLVRQLGLIDTPRGTVAAAIAAKPSDGSLEMGAAQLTQLAEWVAKHARGGTPNC